MAKELYFTGILKSIRIGSKGNRKVIKIDDIWFSKDLQNKLEDMSLESFFRNKKVKIILEE